MNLNNAKKELKQILALVERWDEQGYMPVIERDIALGRLRNIYQDMCAQPNDEQNIPQNNTSCSATDAWQRENQLQKAQNEDRLDDQLENIAMIVSQINAEENCNAENCASDQESNYEQPIICDPDEVRGEAEADEEAMEAEAEAAVLDESSNEISNEVSNETSNELSNEASNESLNDEGDPLGGSKEEGQCEGEAQNELQGESTEESSENSPENSPENRPADQMAEQGGPKPIENTSYVDDEKQLQRRRFVHDLFCNDETFFDGEMRKIDALTSLDEVLIYIGQKYAWTPNNPTAEEFVTMISLRFN